MRLFVNIAGSIGLLGMAWLKLCSAEGMRDFYRTWPKPEPINREGK